MACTGRNEPHGPSGKEREGPVCTIFPRVPSVRAAEKPGQLPTLHLPLPSSLLCIFSFLLSRKNRSRYQTGKKQKATDKENRSFGCLPARTLAAPQPGSWHCQPFLSEINYKHNTKQHRRKQRGVLERDFRRTPGAASVMRSPRASTGKQLGPNQKQNRLFSNRNVNKYGNFDLSLRALSVWAPRSGSGREETGCGGHSAETRRVLEGRLKM